MTRFCCAITFMALTQGCFLKHYGQHELRKNTKKNCVSSSVVYASPLGFFAYNTPSQTPQVMSATCINSKFIIDGAFLRINLPNLQYINGDLSILSPTLQTFSGEYLQEISGSLIIDGRDGAAENINTLSLEHLEYLGGDLILIHIKNMKRLNLPRLKRLERLILLENEGVEEILLPSLREISKEMFIDKNLRLNQLTFHENVEIGPKNRVTDNPKLPKCALAPYKALVAGGSEKTEQNKVTINETTVLKNAQGSPPSNEQQFSAVFIEQGNDNQAKCPVKKKSFFSFLPWF